MQKYKKDNLESSFLSIKKFFSNADKSFLEIMESNFNQLKLEFNYEVINYCLGKYIESELDYTTQGDRGIGRMSNNIPRLGGYFRKQLSKMTNEEYEELYLLIQELFIRGYLARILFVEEKLDNAKFKNGESIFKEWIPLIYISNPLEMGPNLRAYLDVCTLPIFKLISEFMGQHGMQGGILFNKLDRFLSKGKLNEIFSYYILAGFGLRVIEVRGN